MLIRSCVHLGSLFFFAEKCSHPTCKSVICTIHMYALPIPLSSFYRLTFLHFDILSIANSDEIGDLISISRSVVLPSFGERFALLNMSPESHLYFLQGKGKQADEKNQITVRSSFQCQRARTSVSLCRFGTFAKLCLSVCPAARRSRAVPCLKALSARPAVVLVCCAKCEIVGASHLRLCSSVYPYDFCNIYKVSM